MTKKKTSKAAEQKAKPVHVLRIGRIKAVIWENQNGKGTHYSVNLQRVYRLDEDKRKGEDSGWRETTSFGKDDLLLVAKVADLAHSWVTEQLSSQASED